MVQDASNCSTLFWFLLSPSDRSWMFWRGLGCSRSLVCIFVHHVVKSDSNSCNWAGRYRFNLCFLFKSLKKCSRAFSTVLGFFLCFFFFQKKVLRCLELFQVV